LAQTISPDIVTMVCERLFVLTQSSTLHLTV
jgi:hypothetical protein